jgi:hypothetical protein
MRSMALRERLSTGEKHGFQTRLALGGDVGCGPARLDLPANGVAVVSLVGVQKTAGGEAFQEQRTGRAVSNLPSSDQKSDGSAEPVGKRVDLGRASAPRAPDGLGTLHPGPPEAQRCAFTAEESIST